MLYFSTNKKSSPVTLKEAVIRGLAEDGGLFMPETLPVLPQSFISSMSRLSQAEIAFNVAHNFFKDDVPERVIEEIISDSLDFPIPLSRIETGVYCMELFHGPTMAFKDVGARFMSRLMSWLYRNESKQLNVIVATSGDTGSAVAAGFYEVDGINVFVLYPEGKVSPLQKKQITTWGKNIHALEVDGSFDDCQKLAKQIIGDRDMNSLFSLTSANSINIARLIPQSFYYFYAFGELSETGNQLIFSVPSGNFGNLTGGLIARESGLPADRFIAATNINDVFPRFIQTGAYHPSPSKQTISNAMDVGDPSNFDRINELMGHSIVNFRESISSFSFNDRETSEAIKRVYDDTGYIMDPHGAVAYMGLKKYVAQTEGRFDGVFLETAHPAKFPETMERIIEGYDILPPQLQKVIHRDEKFETIGNDLQELKSYIGKVNS
jgi:threonine synthase